MFDLRTPDADWAERAPIKLGREVPISASPSEVFAVLSDHATWPRRFKGMRKVRIDAEGKGIGSLRTVWVGLTHVQERFLIWDEDERLTFAIVKSSTPGLSAMTEDWRLEPTASGTRLRITIGVEPAGLVRLAPKLLESAVRRSTSGSIGITSVFS